MVELADEGAGLISRRDLLRRTGVLGLGALALAGCGSSKDEFVYLGEPSASPVPAVDFFQPEVKRSSEGRLSVPFAVAYATHEIDTPNGKRRFYARSINGTLAPPTLRVKPGDHFEIPLSNRLPANPDPMPMDENTPHHFNTINLHTHGLHVSPAQDNVLLQIEPGRSYTYTYDLPADHPGGAFWYHPHKHGATAMHSFSGMVGALIVEGELDEVPEVAAATDLVFNINELQLQGFVDDATVPQDPYSVPDYVTPSPFASGSSIYMVNGQYQPRMRVRPGQVVRLRILNACARSTCVLSVGAEQPVDWNVLAFDGLTLPEVLIAPALTLSEANRADVLVRFDTPGSYTIDKGAGTSSAVILATIDVAGEPFPQDLPRGRLPVSPTLPDITLGELTEEPRTLTYAMSSIGGPMIGGQQATNMTINGVRFSPSTINEIVSVGSVIEWVLVNQGTAGHVHHIHIHPFQVIATSDGLLHGLEHTLANDPDPLAPVNFVFAKPVWLDTVFIPPGGWVRVRQRFPDFPGLFVLHCHILTHEDVGMMQLVHVV